MGLFCFALVVATASVANAQTVMDVILAQKNLQTLTTALQVSGLDRVLSSATAPAPFTVFAPSDDAFSSGATVQGYKLKYLLDPANVDDLKNLLTYHVLGGVVKNSSSFVDHEKLQTVEGSDLFVFKNATALEINDVTCAKAHVVTPNLNAKNGVVHIISEVFVPEGVFCPDSVFAAEQRDQARISYYGYDCRAKGTVHLTDQYATKPVGLAVDDESQEVFWSDDMDYPHGAPTSWLSKSAFKKESVVSHFVDKIIDPQGMDTDEVQKKLYFTQHYGNSVLRSNYDGTGTEVLVSKPGVTTFQPSDVAVDAKAGRMFVSAEGDEDIYGSLLSYNLNGTDENVLKTNLNRPYGVCVDDVKQHVYYVQGGHGGSISCLAYGSVPCVRDVFADILEYPYMCSVDNAFSKYGGPTTVVFSQANKPGQIFYMTDEKDARKQQIKTVTDDLIAPMGVKFGCVHKVKKN